MSSFLRKVPTASGATAVQIVSKLGGKRRILEHVGSAHTAQEPAALLLAGQQRMAEITETQTQLDLGLEAQMRLCRWQLIDRLWGRFLDYSWTRSRLATIGWVSAISSRITRFSHGVSPAGGAHVKD